MSKNRKKIQLTSGKIARGAISFSNKGYYPGVYIPLHPPNITTLRILSTLISLKRETQKKLYPKGMVFRIRDNKWNYKINSIDFTRGIVHFSNYIIELDLFVQIIDLAGSYKINDQAMAIDIQRDSCTNL